MKIHKPDMFAFEKKKKTRLRACHEARFRAAQESRKHLERQVKMEEYQERRDLEWLILNEFDIYTDIFDICILYTDISWGSV